MLSTPFLAPPHRPISLGAVFLYYSTNRSGTSMHWHSPTFLVLTFFFALSLFITTAAAQNHDMTSEDLEPLFPETLGNATLQEIKPAPEGEGLVAVGEYTDERTGADFSVTLYFGKDVNQAAFLSEPQISRPAQADDWHAEHWSMQGHTVSYMHADGASGGFALIDQFTVFLLARDGADVDTVQAMMEDVDFNQLHDWEAPGAYTAHDLSPDMCLTIGCFADRVASCEAGQVGIESVQALFTVQGPTDDGSCLLSFAYTEHARAQESMLGQELFFPVRANADVVGNFREAVFMPAMACMSGESDSEHCGGPLLEQRPE